MECINKSSAEKTLKPTLAWRGSETHVFSGLGWVRISHRASEIPALRVNRPADLATLTAALKLCCQAILDGKPQDRIELFSGKEKIALSYSPDNGSMPVSIWYRHGLKGSEFSCLHQLETDIAFDLQRWLARSSGEAEITLPDSSRLASIRIDNRLTATLFDHYHGNLELVVPEADHLISQLLLATESTGAGSITSAWLKLTPVSPASYNLAWSSNLVTTCQRSTLALLALAADYEQKRYREKQANGSGAPWNK